jgi:hypothetical protein
MRYWIVVVLSLWSGVAQAGTLEDVRSLGVLQCGVDSGVLEFSASQVNGVWQGLPVEFCRALAFAVNGDRTKVNFTILLPEERIEALQSGEVDVLVSSLAISAVHETRDGVLFSEALFTNTQNAQIYGAAVRQGDDAWFVAVKWLRQLLLSQDAKPCASFDDVSYFAKNWGCEILAQQRPSFGYPQKQ